MSEILIVDDNPANLDLFSRILRGRAHHVRTVTSGRHALESSEAAPPDLVLLDVTMPEMDGYETCRQFKIRPALASIPIIFISALDDVLDKVRAFSLGGVDFITKPLQEDEAVARVEHQLKLLALQKALEERNRQLQILNEQKNQFLGIVAHDIRNPLGAMVLAAQIIEAEEDPDVVRKYARSIVKEGMEMSQLIGRFLDYVRIESGQVRPQPELQDAVGVVRQLCARYETRMREKGLALAFAVPEGTLPVWADPKFLGEIVDNLVSNAVKYSPAGKVVTLRLEMAGDEVVLSVEDQGPGLTAEDRQRLFGQFSVLSARPTGGEKSTGLGLSIVKNMVDAMGGHVWVDSEPGCGAAFRVALPSGETRLVPQ
jgi:signal transduction histidine kinase